MFRLEKFYAPGFNAQEYWDDKYAKEHRAGKSSEEFKSQDFWPLMQRHLEKGKRYLDASCGIGGWILFLRDEGYDVEGIDTRARTLRAMTEYDRDLKLKIAPMTAIPYANNSLDGVIAIGAVEYLENSVEKAVSEAYRVLKPGGFFLLEVPLLNAIRRAVYVPLKKLQRAVKSGQPSFAMYLFTPQDVESMLEYAGFEISDVEPHELPAANSHYGLYIDWPFLRGSKPYELNILGRLVKAISNTISPWIASTGIVVVAKKK